MTEDEFRRYYNILSQQDENRMNEPIPKLFLVFNFVRWTVLFILIMIAGVVG